MSAVAKQTEVNIVPMDEAASLMEVISRVASDPNTDVSKLERLMAMYERMESRTAKAAYSTALAEMQEELPTIHERGEIKIGSTESKKGQTYALWEDINRAIKPIMAKHGFALSFRTGQAEGKITVTGILSHKAGHSEETTIHLPSDTSGSKNAVQAVGSSTSYGKRYTTAALLNLTSTDEDDDGQAAGGNAPITPEQLEELNEMLGKCDGDPEKFCKYMKVDAMALIMQKDIGKAREALNHAIDEYQRNKPKSKI